MILSCRQFVALLFAISALTLCGDTLPVAAQAKKAGPSLTSPQSPKINFPNLSGARRGTVVEVTITGNNLTDPVAVWTSFPAKATFPTDMNNGKVAGKLRIKLDVPADAPIGFHTLRVATKHGISNAQIFCIDELPQIAEVDTNQAKSTAQPVEVPCVVMGRAEVEKSDFFKISVKPGERVTFEVLGRRLGSAFDPIILLHDAKSGRDIPGLYSDDAPGLQTDARLTHTFKEGGDFLVEVRDTTYRGGPDYFYRLRIGDFPAAIAAIPVAIKRGSNAQVTFAGPSVEGVTPIDVLAPNDPTQTVVYVAPKRPGGLSGWPVPVFLSDIDEFVETEPNNEMAKANHVPVPRGVTGRFLEKGDIDVFGFSAKKGTKYVIAAETYEINSPTEIYLVLKNAKNAELGKSVPSSASARIEYTAAEDGDLFIYAEHLNYAHGPNEFYHLTIRTAEPDFDVILGGDQFEAAPGGATLIPVTAVVRRNYTGPIELSVKGRSGLSGSVTIPAGIPAANAPPGQAGQTIAYLPLKVNADVPMGAYEFSVQTKAVVDGKEFMRLANVTDIVKQRMANLELPPREMLTSLGLCLTDKPLFVLAAKMPLPDIVRGAPATVTLAATRAAGFAEEIALSAVNPPANVTIAAKPIGKGSNEIGIQVTAAANATPGDFPIFFRATTKSGGKDFVYYSGAIPITIAAEKKTEKKPDAKNDEKKTDKKDEKKTDKKDEKKP